MKMYRYLIPIIVSLPLLSCGQSGGNGVAHVDTLASSSVLEMKETERDAVAGHLLAAADAEKILGTSAQLTDSVASDSGDASTYRYTYKALAADPKTGKTGAIYYLLERYALLSAAKSRYSFIKTANEKNGIKTLHDLGDEAYFHSDGQNFYFVMVRKGNWVLTMKVNKITSTTSLDDFNRVARKSTAQL
jgi:hypothetical protein